MVTVAGAAILLSLVGSATAFGIWLVNIATEKTNPVIQWIQSLPPIEIVALLLSILVLIMVAALRPKPRRRRR